MSILVLVVALIVPAMVLGTTGLNVEAQTAILRRVDDIGARTITVVSTGAHALIPAEAVERIASMSGVEWVVGLGPVFDARSRGGGREPTPVRAYRGADAPIALGDPQGTSGAYISAASARRLGLSGAYGVLDPGSLPILGWFRTEEPLRALDAFVLVPTNDDRLSLERLIVAVEHAGWVDVVAANLPAMLGRDAAQGVSVQPSAALLQAREAVRQEGNRRDRLVVVSILAVGMALSAVVVSAGTLGSRRDFGRRRALGATRLQLTVLVVLATLWPAGAGAIAGAAAGWVYLTSKLAHVPDWQFPTAVGLLTVIVIAGASAAPAAVAATRDPLRVLRIP